RPTGPRYLAAPACVRLRLRRGRRPPRVPTPALPPVQEIASPALPGTAPPSAIACDACSSPRLPLTIFDRLLLLEQSHGNHERCVGHGQVTGGSLWIGVEMLMPPP